MPKKLVRKVKKVKRKYKQKQKQKQSQKVIINIGKPKASRKQKRKSKPKPFISETLSSVLIQPQQPAFSTADLQTLLNAQRQTSVVGSLPQTEKAKTTLEIATPPVKVMDEKPKPKRQGFGPGTAKRKIIKEVLIQSVERRIAKGEAKERELMGAEDTIKEAREERERGLMGMEDVRAVEDIEGILPSAEIPQVPMRRLPSAPIMDDYYYDAKNNRYIPRGYTYDKRGNRFVKRTGLGEVSRDELRGVLIGEVEVRNPQERARRTLGLPQRAGARGTRDIDVPARGGPTFTPRLGNFMSVQQEIREGDIKDLTEADMREMGYM